MKKIIIYAIFLFTAFGIRNANSQVGVNININIGSQPVWGPVGYDYVDYYYMPDIETYYYVPTRQFIYLSGGNWIFAYSLPSRYRTYNLYSGYKVVVNQPKAYKYFSTHKVKYAGFKGNRSQVVIKNSNDPKYFVVKGHPKHSGSKAKATPGKAKSGGGNKAKASKGKSGGRRG